MAAKKKTVKPAASKFVGGVHVAASLERTPPSSNYHALKKLFLNQKGELTATANCGDEAFVCTKAEIPALVTFLTKIATAKAAAA